MGNIDPKYFEHYEQPKPEQVIGNLLKMQREAYLHLFELCRKQPYNELAILECWDLLAMLNEHLLVASIPSPVLNRLAAAIKQRSVEARLYAIEAAIHIARLGEALGYRFFGG